MAHTNVFRDTVLPLLRLTACACSIALPSQCFLDQNDLSRVLSSCSNLASCRPAACHAKDSWLLAICRDFVLILTKAFVLLSACAI